ncbi:Dihydrolipoyllysine-residue acetyltransferase component of pyruvate dehydrogenase complex [Chlamydiales bacterium SCGC AB-751-O23]|jgi:pyruvate dehydrogenase E2 component (dihydrolipoamide acetyltransferase)|nr:Dihydrolipoyllysine-residue acetyltransferase component of pyruvate dehydrogenase complex [Chlamydiales bacterium SCGC AB-751-O23]
MPFTLSMPKLSPTMEEGTITTWFKKEGDFIEAGELLMEVATDKAQIEFNAIDEGFLRKILIPKGKEAKINDVIAVFSEKKAEKIEAFLKKIQNKEKKQEVKIEKKQAIGSGASTQAGSPVAATFMTFEPFGEVENDSFMFPVDPIDRVKASPLAKKVAKDKNLDLSTIKGSGPGGRIVKKDLVLAQKTSPANFGPKALPKLKAGAFEELQLSPMRKVISQKLQAAKASIPHYYVTEKIDVDNLISLRKQLKEAGTKVSINDFIVRACALALKEHPEINRGFNSKNNSIIQFKTVDISIAVSVESGLITPIVFHTDHKNLGQISQEIKQLATLAKSGKLEPHQYQGGSFTISNLGMFGVENFQAVINPPQAAILAIAGIKQEPVVKGGQIVIGNNMNICLSSDHRVIDGAQAAQFLVTLKKSLENPAILLL